MLLIQKHAARLRKVRWEVFREFLIRNVSHSRSACSDAISDQGFR